MSVIQSAYTKLNVTFNILVTDDNCQYNFIWDIHEAYRCFSRWLPGTEIIDSISFSMFFKFIN